MPINTQPSSTASRPLHLSGIWPDWRLECDAEPNRQRRLTWPRSSFLSQNVLQCTLPYSVERTCVVRAVPVYFLSVNCTHCTHTRKDGQAELTWKRRTEPINRIVDVRYVGCWWRRTGCRVEISCSLNSKLCWLFQAIVDEIYTNFVVWI